MVVRSHTKYKCMGYVHKVRTPAADPAPYRKKSSLFSHTHLKQNYSTGNNLNITTITIRAVKSFVWF